MYALGYVDDPKFRAVYIRQTSVQLRQSGGLWDTALSMYAPFKPRPLHQNMTMRFQSGAVVQFKTLGSDKETNNFDGGQYSLVVFDEAQWHTQNQVMYLLSRLRSEARGPHKLLCTCNPLKTSFLLKFVDWYLDKTTGIPEQDKSGVTRYFAQYRGDLVFADSVEEMQKLYPGTNPMSYTFISATEANGRKRVTFPLCPEI